MREMLCNFKVIFQANSEAALGVGVELSDCVMI